MNYILFDDNWKSLLPLTFTRPVCELRTGILTIKEKWERYINTKFSYHTQNYLQEKFALHKEDDNLLVNGSIYPTPQLVERIINLHHNQALVYEGSIVAVRLWRDEVTKFEAHKMDRYEQLAVEFEVRGLKNTWDIFAENDKNIVEDYNLLTKGRESFKLSTTNTIIGNNLFVESNAKIECATLNATKGPIYIGENVEVMEGTMLRGPLALCHNTIVKMGTKIYGPTTIGPHCKIGGEISNVSMQAYTNKAHNGYLGNSVLGEWCNLGAGTNSSNLKNDYANIKLWDYEKDEVVDTNLQICGMIMGDHSKSAIETMFNTGTVIGVSANIFGTGFARNFIPSFSWGGNQQLTEYRLDKAIITAKKVMKRRGMELHQLDKTILQKIYKKTELYREGLI